MQSKGTPISASQAQVIWVAPHALFFIGDQLNAVRKRVRKVSMLIPDPWFSGLASYFPLASNRFASLRRARESARILPAEDLLRPRYFDLPGNLARGWTGSLAGRSSEEAVAKSGISFDVIHSHFLGLYGNIGERLKESLHKPLVISAYGGDAYKTPLKDSFSRKMAEAQIRAADLVIAVSRSLSLDLTRLGANPGKVVVIPTGFDSTEFRMTSKESARSNLGLPGGKKVILNVGNLVEQKGQSYLLRGFAKASKSRQDLVLAVVGGGGLAGALRAEADMLGLGDNVIFAGARPHSEIPAWMNACDLFVLSSVSEGSPTVIPEAMACGMPVVATRVGGIPDVVHEGNGIMVPAKDPASLADSIIRALEQDWDKDSISRHSQAYSWDSLSEKVVFAYQRAMGG